MSDPELSGILTGARLLLKAQTDTIDDAVALLRLLYEKAEQAQQGPIESMIMRLENMKRSL